MKEFEVAVNAKIHFAFMVEAESKEEAESKVDTLLRFECPSLDEWDWDSHEVATKERVENE